MGRGTTAGDADYYPSGLTNEVPEHPATVSSFALDKFEVTVGRFRKWVDQFSGVAPAAGAGANPNVPGSGWKTAWNNELSANRGALLPLLSCSSTHHNWTASPGSNENYPMNCVSWYEASAFCIWDGGRLPTEAEWEYAASGGVDSLFPWGSLQPSALLANFSGGARNAHIDVGSTPAGNNGWGHADLAGSMWEWALDYHDANWYSGNGASCTNCANLAPATYRVIRGGDFQASITYLRAATRSINTPTGRYSTVGWRCARTP